MTWDPIRVDNRERTVVRNPAAATIQQAAYSADRERERQDRCKPVVGRERIADERLGNFGSHESKYQRADQRAAGVQSAKPIGDRFEWPMVFRKQENELGTHYRAQKRNQLKQVILS